MENILNNCDILQLIFHHLDLEEHLKMIKICEQFEYAIIHGVWRLMYKNLHILEAPPDNFLLQYNTVNNVMTECSLTPEAINIILHHASMYIQKLKLNYISCLKNIISFNYHHLIELSLCDILVEAIHLQQVAENCLNLQNFSLKRFTNSKNQSNICANVFGEMKALNKLEISDFGLDWNYFDVQQLFCLDRLKTLIIEITLLYKKGSNYNSTDRVYNIENLTIGALPCLQSANECFIKDLRRFENLTKLTLTSGFSVILYLDDNDLTQINNACPKLCELSLHQCYLRFKEIPRMKNLQHLTFVCCWNMRVENIVEVFRKLNLKSLSIDNFQERDKVNAEDISAYNYISNTLETLTIIDGFYRNIARTFFNRQHKFENVSKITLEMWSNPLAESAEMCFSHNFPNLQELIMNSFNISSGDILNLKHLKVLQFDLFENMSWSYLEILFKHPTLTHITITPSFFSNIKQHYEANLPKSCEGFTTTLEYLSLPSVLYERTLSFWSSFRQRNKLLKLEIGKVKEEDCCNPMLFL